MSRGWLVGLVLAVGTLLACLWALACLASWEMWTLPLALREGRALAEDCVVGAAGDVGDMEGEMSFGSAARGEALRTVGAWVASSRLLLGFFGFRGAGRADACLPACLAATVLTSGIGETALDDGAIDSLVIRGETDLTFVSLFVSACILLLAAFLASILAAACLAAASNLEMGETGEMGVFSSKMGETGH